MNARRLTWLLLGLATVASLSWAGAASVERWSGDPVSPVVFPAQQIPLRFSHVQHLRADEDLTCTSCHVEATGSRSALDNLIPPEAACTGCHAIDRARPMKEVDEGEPPARCDACHPGWEPGTGTVARVKIPMPNLKFDHAAHAGAEIGCQRCHGDLEAEGVELATREQLPKMRVCLECHDGTEQSDECTLCHLAGPGGYLETEFASGDLRPSGTLRGAAHDMRFQTGHARVAENDPDYCARCHRRDFCVECHAGTVKPMAFHVGDYVTLHPIEARRNDPDCSGCHRLQSFCVGCHNRSGVNAEGRGSDFEPGSRERRFHPAGWSGAGDWGPEHHAFQAQRNIRQCASCHREQFCVRCHSAEVGTMQANPHPPGWSGSRRCRALLARNARLCLRCHVRAAELSCAR